MSEDLSRIEELLTELHDCSPDGDAARTRETALFRRLCRIIAPAGRLEPWTVETGLLGRIVAAINHRGRSAPELVILFMTWCLEEQLFADDLPRLGNAHQMLGNAYRLRYELTGDAPANFHQAESHYRQSLEAFAEARDRNRCVAVHHDLGLLQQLNADGIAALKEFRIALSMCSEGTSIEERTELHSDIAMTLLSSDESGPQEEAIRHLETAAAQVDKHELPALWASVQARLGLAHARRLSGDRLANVKNAIQQFRIALRTYTDLNDPSRSAEAASDLGRMLVERTELGDGDFAAEAINSFQVAQLVYTEAVSPERWASLEGNIAKAFTRGRFRDVAENLKVASAHFRNAARIYEIFGAAELAKLYVEMAAAHEQKFALEQQILAFKAEMQKTPDETVPE
jgi:tetratricopeptide (TPR) repeat protein